MVCLTTKLKPSNKLFWFLLQFAFVKSCIIVICFVGSNILQAKMATRKAKPNGQYHLKLRDVIIVVGFITTYAISAYDH
jgi:hypothetical protein